MIQNILGKGMDCHLLALKRISEANGLGTPDLFKDETYSISNKFALSTSQVSNFVPVFFITQLSKFLNKRFQLRWMNHLCVMGLLYRMVMVVHITQNHRILFLLFHPLNHAIQQIQNNFRTY